MLQPKLGGLFSGAVTASGGNRILFFQAVYFVSE